MGPIVSVIAGPSPGTRPEPQNQLHRQSDSPSRRPSDARREEEVGSLRGRRSQLGGAAGGAIVGSGGSDLGSSGAGRGSTLLGTGEGLTDGGSRGPRGTAGEAACRSGPAPPA